MDVTSEQIVTGLIAFYKRNGVDLTYLLGDPTFQSLKTKEKVEAIKTHAKELYANSTDSLTRAEKTNILGEALFTAGATLPVLATLAMTSVAKGWYPGVHSHALKVGGGAAIIGSLAAGAIKAGFKTSDALAHRRALRRELYNASVNPTTDAAVGVLSSSAIQNQAAPLRKLLLDKAHVAMDKAWDPAERTVATYQQNFDSRADELGLPSRFAFGPDNIHTYRFNP